MMGIEVEDEVETKRKLEAARWELRLGELLFWGFGILGK